MTDARTRLVAIMSVVAIVFTTIVSIVFTERADAAAPDTRPNILFITADDQADTDLAYMPLTQKLLAEQGVNFTDGMSSHPLCCPGRGIMFTGEQAHNNGVHHNTGDWGGYDAFIRNGNRDDQIGKYLSDAGYKTAMIGKMMNGYVKDSPQPRGFDYWSPTLAGTYAYYGTTFFNDGDPRTYDNKYVADVVRDQTVTKINEWSQGGEPFFIWSSHVGPHTAEFGDSEDEGAALRVTARGRAIPADRHYKTMDDLRMPSRDKPSFYEQDVSDKPREIRDNSRPQGDELEEAFQRRVEALQAIDESNAASIQALIDNGEIDNTVIIYTSDNGWMYGEHGLIGKNVSYEENFQVPFLMRAPDAPIGVELPLGPTLVDIAPTFLDYAGVLGQVRRQTNMDGMSLRDSLSSRTLPNDTTLVQAGAINRPWLFRGVRTSRYTWVVWKESQFELYDRATDPFEMENLVDVDTGQSKLARYRPVLAELKDRYSQLKDCRGVSECELQDFGASPVPARRK